MGLGCCCRTWGGGGYATPRGCISYKARIKPLCGIKHTRRCNCKQRKRKRLISHYIAYKTDVSHISGKIHVRQKTQNATEQPEDGTDVCVRAYLNPHITCHLSPLSHVPPYRTTIIRRHSAPLHYTPYITPRYKPYTYTTAGNRIKSAYLPRFILILSRFGKITPI